MTRYQKLIVAILAFLQFTIILDFMILSPLGALLMPALQITPAQFSLVVSVYAFSAGTSGLLAAGFADRFDRKKLLLFFYGGFLAGTFLCAIAPTYTLLLMARIVTGLFGGVIGSIVFAISTDLFAFELRGRVMGFIQTAFGASQVLGIPAGLYLSNRWGWHMPFFLIVGVGSAVGLLILLKMKPVVGHLKHRVDRNPFHHLIVTVSNPRYLQAFATTALLSTGGFMLMPFSSAFSVHNLGISMERLPMVYLATGTLSMFMGPIIGRASDKFGKFRMFLFGTLLSMLMIYIYTHLGVTPIGEVILINAILWIGISSRLVSSSALMSAVPTPETRGSFMSVSSSIQSLSGGLASVLAGMIVVKGVGGHLEHFDRLGYVVMLAGLITVVMMFWINRSIGKTAMRVAS